LAALAGRVPVPPLLDAGDSGGETRTGWVAGRHGQDLIAAGRAAEVLDACGGVLRQIQAVDPRVVLGPEPGSGVLVHGDFGPQNLLLADDLTVAAVLDWEWVHVGDPLEDLAWAEWIVRMHHPAEGGALTALFDSYGDRPPWSWRQAAMVERCRELAEFSRRWEPDGPGVRQWEERLAVTAGWGERPGSTMEQ